MMGTVIRAADRRPKTPSGSGSGHGHEMRLELQPLVLIRRTNKFMEALRARLPSPVLRALDGMLCLDLREHFVNNPLPAEKAEALAAILPSERELREGEAILLRAVTQPCLEKDTKRILGTFLAMKSSMKAEGRAGYILGLEFLVNFESEIEEYSAAALAAALYSLTVTKTFLPDPAEIIPEIAEWQTRMSAYAKRIEDLIEIRTAVDDALLEAGWTYAELGTPENTIDPMEEPPFLDSPSEAKR